MIDHWHTNGLYVNRTQTITAGHALSLSHMSPFVHSAEQSIHSPIGHCSFLLLERAGHWIGSVWCYNCKKLHSSDHDHDRMNGAVTGQRRRRRHKRWCRQGAVFGSKGVIIYCCCKKTANSTKIHKLNEQEGEEDGEEKEVDKIMLNR